MTKEINFWNDWKQDQANSRHSKGKEMTLTLEGKCPRCKEGKILRNCPICHGTGQVPKADTSASVNPKLREKLDEIFESYDANSPISRGRVIREIIALIKAESDE